MSFEDTYYFFGCEEISTLTEDTLSGSDVVSGFEHPVAEVFE